MLKKIQNTTVIFLFISLMLIYFSVFAYAQDNIKTVRVGYYLQEDYQEKSNSGIYRGYNYEFYKLIAQYTHWKYEFIEASFEECIEMLKNGEIDIIGGISSTDELKKYVDFSDFPYQCSQYEIYTKVNNNDLYYEAFEDFDEISIGVLKGDQQTNQLDKYAKIYNFRYKKVEFTSFFEMETALKYGKIDAIFSCSVGNITNCKIIGRPQKIPIYFGVTKGNNKLLNELNDALKNILNINPNFKKYLDNKYTYYNQHLIPSFSKSEIEYMQSKPTIYILVEKDWQPITYYDKNKNSYKGIFVDIIEYISRITDLNFNYCTQEELPEIIKKDNSIDVVSILTHDFNWGDKHNANISNMILNAPVVMIANNPKVKKVDITAALPKGFHTSYEVEHQLHNCNIVFYDDIEACLQAVNRKKADVTYLNDYVASYYLSHLEYKNLYIASLSNIAENLSLAVSKDSDERLLPMINKALICLSNEHLNRIILKNNIIKYDITLKTIFYSYPEETVLIIVGIAIFIIFILSTAIHNNKKKKERIKEALLETSLSNERFKVALHQISCDIFEYDFATNGLFHLDKLTGIKTLIPLNDSEALKKSSIKCSIFPEFVNIFDDIYGRVLAGETNIVVTLKGNDNGNDVWGKFTLTTVFDDGKPIRMIGTMADVTAEKGADLDSLTGLHNRGSIARSMIDELNNNDTSMFGAFLMVDMDDFKGINDTYGHYSGDTCLMHVAHKLKSGFRTGDIVARMGGDEFAVFFKDVPSAELAIKKSTKIFNKINGNSVLLKDGTEIKIRISMGIAIYPIHGDDFAKLYQNADSALYRAKQANKSQFRVFNQNNEINIK